MFSILGSFPGINVSVVFNISSFCIINANGLICLREKVCIAHVILLDQQIITIILWNKILEHLPRGKIFSTSRNPKVLSF